MRNKTIDVLRVVGLFSVISAHVFHNPLFKNIRNFDVVMLVFIAGMSFSYNKIDFDFKSGINYTIHRIKKLLGSTWGYLLFHFVFFTILGFKFSTSTILSSFCLLNGIGYVWIIRIYLTIAILSPLFKRIINKMSESKFVFLMVLLLFINEGLYYIFANVISYRLVGKALYYLITFTLGYMIVFWIGQKWKTLSKQSKGSLFSVVLAIFTIFSLFNGKFDIQPYKMPPQMIYLTYGLSCSFILYELVNSINLFKDRKLNVLTWISKNSIGIYLWHIFSINILSFYKVEINNLYIYYLIIILMSCLITRMVEYFSSILKVKYNR